MAASATWWLKREIIEKPPANIQFLTDRVHPCQLEVLCTPGHSPGSVCLYSEKDKVLFTGDTLFARGTVGRTDFPYGSKKDLEKSLAKLSKFQPETIIYPGHGESSTLGENLQKISQPFFSNF